MFDLWVDEIFELFNSTVESEGINEKEQAPLNKNEIVLEMDFKITVYKKEMEIIGL